MVRVCPLDVAIALTNRRMSVCDSFVTLQKFSPALVSSPGEQQTADLCGIYALIFTPKRKKAMAAA